MLGKDSDFFVLPVPYYLVLDTLKLHANPPLVTAYARADVLRLLQLDERHLPLFASLCGNDFVQVKKKKLPHPYPSKQTLDPLPYHPLPYHPLPYHPLPCHPYPITHPLPNPTPTHLRGTQLPSALV